MKFKKFKFKKVRSTNNTAIRIIKKTNCKYGMVISEIQTNGKGQYGRKWISHKGNLFVTFFHELSLSSKPLYLFSSHFGIDVEHCLDIF